MALQGFTLGSGSSPEPASPTASASTGSGGVLKGFSLGQTNSPTPAPVVAPTPAPQQPIAAAVSTPDTSGFFSKFLDSFKPTAVGKGLDILGKLTAQPDAAAVGKDPSALNRTLAYLPSELARAIPGVAQIQDDTAQISEEPQGPKVLPEVISQGRALTAQKADIDAQQGKVDTTDQSAITDFNDKVAKYNADLAHYQKTIEVYNNASDEDQKQGRTGYAGIEKYLDKDTVNKSVVPAAIDFGKGSINAPLTGVADIAGAVRQASNQEGAISYDIPGLGTITNTQFNIAQRIANGEDPAVVGISEGSKAFLDVLSLVGMIKLATDPRFVTVAQSEGTIEGSTNTPKTGRLYEPSVASTNARVLTPGEVQNLKLGSRFTPEQPVFLRSTLGKGGKFTTEIVQIKPSYLESAYTKLFGGKNSNVTLPSLIQEAPLTEDQTSELVQSAKPGDTTVLHSSEVKAGDIVNSINKSSAAAALVPQTPSPAIPAVPSSTLTVAHNALRLTGGDTAQASGAAATLRQEIKDSIAKHGSSLTHTMLQEKLGVDVTTADILIREAKASYTDQEFAKLNQRALNIATAPKALKGFKVNDVEGAFNESKEQSPVGDFELGSFGKNAIERKSDQSDRFPISELEETAKHIVTAYKGSNNTDTYRKDNIAHIAEMPDGERRVIYTRQNASGKEEIINAHKISNPAFEEQLKSFGTPERTRTAIRSLEGSSPNPLEDRGTSKVDELAQDVNESLTEGNGSIEDRKNLVFHGTKADIGDIRDLQPLTYGDAQALYGPGVYLTDKESVALGYSKTKGTGQGKILAGELNPNLKFLDLDSKLSKQEIPIFEQALNSPVGDLMEGDQSLVSKTGVQAIQLIRENLSEAHIPKYEAAEVFFQLQQNLAEALGYDGFAHIGGLNKGEAHNVKILFDYGDKEKSIASKFKRNIPRGFVKVPALPDVGAKIAEVKDFIEQSQKTTELTGTVTDTLYQLEGARKANRQREIQLLQNRGTDFTAEEWEQLYDYDEGVYQESGEYYLLQQGNEYKFNQKTATFESTGKTNVTKGKLPQKLQEVYDSTIVLIKEAQTKARAEYRELGGVITSDLKEDLTPRFVKEKSGPIDKLLSIKKRGEEVIRNGSLMSKSVGAGAKHRLFHAAVDEEGNRTIIHIPTAKNSKVTAFKNDILSDLGTINSQKRETLLKEEVAPIQKKLRTVQKLFDTLESIKTRDPVSSKKLSTLEARIEALKQYAKDRQEKTGGYTKIYTQMEKDIEKASERAADLSKRLRALKPFGNVPKVAKAIDQLQKDIDAAYEHEANLSGSDIYEDLFKFAEKNGETKAQVIKDLAKTTAEFRTLVKVPKGSDVVLTKARMKNAIDKMRELSNEMAEIEAKYNPEDLENRVFKGSDGKVYEIKQATTKEIEANTKTRYHKNPLANYILSYDRTISALSALKLNYHLINNFPEVIQKEIEGEAAPDGWLDGATTGLPQFRNTWLDPKVHEAITDLATRLKGREAFPVLDEINNLLTSLIVLNPIMHFPNVTQGWATAQAGSGVIPGATAKSRANFATAVNEVRNKGPIYLSYLEHGAPLMALKNTARDFTDAVLTQYAEVVKEQPDEFAAVSKILGYTNPLAWFRGLNHINEAITWGGNDIMFLHAILDYADKNNSTPEEAIKEISKRMADYRLPSRVGPGKLGRAVSLTMQSRGFLFARYHYSGVIKPWIESIKDTAAPGSNAKERLAGLRALAYLGLMSLVVYPYINKLLQGITGDAKTYISMAGPTKLVQNVEKLHESGAAGIPAFVQGNFTLSPALTAAIELGFNIDLYTRNPIYGLPPAQGLGEFAISMAAPLSSSSRMNAGDFALSLFGIYTPKSTASRNALNAQKYDELPVLQVQVKKDIIEGNTDKAQAEMAEFNNRAIANWNTYQLEIGAKPLAADGSENADFLKEWGISTPGQKALVNAATLYADGSLTSKSSLLDGIVTYAKAIGDDPATAFERVFTGQRILRVDNFGILSPDSAVIVERLPLTSSETIRSKQAAAQGISKDQLGTMQLDHFIPLEAGGSNDESNLDLVTTYQNEVLHNDVETPIAAALKNGDISRAKAQEYLVRYKIGTLGESPNEKYVNLYKNKYNSQPITVAEIVAEINAGKSK